jgi:pyruvate/2-oxoglutarate dehydrogenase complex dihydrolipoamide acyltransferase (E2) component
MFDVEEFIAIINPPEAAILAVGAVSFSILRRSMQPEPSPLPPSVEVTPAP